MARGIDGGNWYSCRSAETDFELHCKIYGDDGNIVMEDDFELYISLNNTGKEIPMKDFQKQTYLTADNVSAFNDASDIYMQGSLVLKSKKSYLGESHSLLRLMINNLDPLDILILID